NDKDNLVSFNMASMRTADDLIQALNEVRNVAITGKLPMLFLDEIDNKDENFGLLLPLLWDGQIQVGINRIRIGRAVIVAAGSKDYLVDHKNIPPPKDSKLRDFISRLKFDTKIPPLEPVDQVCIAIAVLRHMYANGNGSEVLKVPVSLLNFIYDIKFSYGVRSIKHLINFLWTGDKSQDIKKGVLNIDRLSRALSNSQNATKSGLLAHIREAKGDEEAQPDPRLIVMDWERAADRCGQETAPIWCELFREVGVGAPFTWPEDRVEFYNAQLLREQSDDDWYTFVGAGIDGVGVLYFFPDRGVWQHGNPQLRHIFFNLRTIATIVKRFGKDEKVLFSLGYDMGSAFGQDFLKRVAPLKAEKTDVNMKMETLIQKWCKFDISGGWGFWDSKGDEITVKNSFFVEMDKDDVTDEDHAPHCAIMRGYIAGVLEAFSDWLDVHDKFDVHEKRCGVQDAKDKEDTTQCTFK